MMGANWFGLTKSVKTSDNRWMDYSALISPGQEQLLSHTACYYRALNKQGSCLWHLVLKAGVRFEALNRGARCIRLDCFQPNRLAERVQETPRSRQRQACSICLQLWSVNFVPCAWIFDCQFSCADKCPQIQTNQQKSVNWPYFRMLQRYSSNNLPTATVPWTQDLPMLQLSIGLVIA